MRKPRNRKLHKVQGSCSLLEVRLGFGPTAEVGPLPVPRGPRPGPREQRELAWSILESELLALHQAAALIRRENLINNGYPIIKINLPQRVRFQDVDSVLNS